MIFILYRETRMLNATFGQFSITMIQAFFYEQQKQDEFYQVQRTFSGSLKIKNQCLYFQFDFWRENSNISLSFVFYAT